MRRLGFAAGTLTALFPTVAFGHNGHEVGVTHSAWNEVPGIVLMVMVLGLPYAIGTSRLWSRAGRGRGVRLIEATSFAAGVLVLAGALLGPTFVPLTDEFSGHMGQHLLLIVVSAPLLAFGRPGIAYAWFLRVPRARSARTMMHWGARSRLGRLAGNPLILLAVYVATIWIWHMPTLYNAAARNEPLHLAEHLTMLAAAFAFWSRISSLEVGTARRQAIAFLLLVAVMLPSLALGAVITFANTPLYEPHQLATEIRGGDPLRDQALGGLVMLMLGGLTYALVALAGMFRLLSRVPPQVDSNTERTP